jgi:hypothetical protein
MKKMTLEWCVMHPDYPDSPHRGPMSRDEAIEWVREAVQDDGMREGLFYVACRPVGEWEKA